MQTSETKPVAVTIKKPKQNIEDTPLTSRKRTEDEKRRKIDSLVTPRNYGQNASPYDIYGQKKNMTKAPKKAGTTSVSKESPMRNALKSSASSVSQMSNYSAKSKIITTPKQPSSVNKVVITKKPLINTSVTVNSPLTKRKLDLTETSGVNEKTVTKRSVEKGAKGKDENNDGRQRSKTRTLKKDEVKVLTPDNLDNNEEMRKLTRKFEAEPKAFYVNLSDEEPKPSKSKPKGNSHTNTEEDYSDDFESYESDFESYKSETSLNGTDNAETSDHSEVQVDETEDKSKRDEERMLDSGSFDLRDAQRSATKSKSILDDIVESSTNVEDKRSLTDEGFQDMSGSANSSMKHDVMDSVPFMDFEKTKSNRKRIIASRRLKQRAKDILSMVTLHEMYYSLFEFHPIPYDVYMTTFGRNNYTQRATQTFDDGITVDIQTDEIATETKWTQNPVDFSKHLICLEKEENMIRKTKSETVFLCKFTFLLEKDVAVKDDSKDTDESYKENPLRIYLEQKDGVGTSEIMDKDKFELKIKNPPHNQGRLKKFLRKKENIISSILNLNAGNTLLNETLPSFLPFSRGYSNLFDVTQKDLQFLKNKPITSIVFSKTKNSLLFSVHSLSIKNVKKKSIACLWDISVASRKPLKILTAIDKLELCLFTGNYDGIFVGSLSDGSIHVWDLSEEPSTINVASDKDTTEMVEINTTGLTQFEIDREWNFRNSKLNESVEPTSVQSSAFTSSFTNVTSGDAADSIVGLQFGTVERGMEHNEFGKILCQLCSLQKMGILTLWLVVQERSNSKLHSGKAMWSKIHLERTHTINLMENIENTIKSTKFDLQSVKKRLSTKKKSFSRPKSAVSNSSFKSDSLSVASDKNISQSGRNYLLVLPISWDSGIECTDLKVIKIEFKNVYLVAKNCGEVLLCRKSAGSVVIEKLLVATDQSMITCLETSLLDLPYFLAGTDTGTLHLCSLVDHRVVLTLDNGNTTPNKEDGTTERCHGDMKGRYLGSIPVKPHDSTRSIDHCFSTPSISSIAWSVDNPCHMFTLSRDGAVSVWDLTFSDINCKAYFNEVAVKWTCFDGGMAIITNQNEVQIHKTTEDTNRKLNVEIFNKYIKLL